MRLTTLGSARLGREPAGLIAAGGNGSGPTPEISNETDPAATVLGAGKPLALLIYLAFSPGHSARRETLTDLLWADMETERARHALRQALWQLRQILGDGALVGKDEIELTQPVASDRADFLAAVESGELEAAVAIYAGPFVPGFAAPGGAAFEQWADLERDRLRGVYFRTADMLVRRRLAASQFRDAQRLARRTRDEMPSNELGWRLLLEALAAGGDFISAGAEADSLEQWAAQERTALDPSTLAAIRVARQIRTERQNGDRAPLAAELVGREREFAAIVQAWERARRGETQHIHVSAPAGLGKTRLLRDVETRLRAGGARVVTIRVAPGDRLIPYAFASELARAVVALPGAICISPASAGALVALHPPLSARLTAPRAVSASNEDVLRLSVIALAEALGAAAEDEPFALLIDDVHWMDEVSRRLLDGLIPRLSSVPVAIVTAARPTRDLGPVLTQAVTIGLLPISAAQVGEFVASIATLPSDATWTDDLIVRLAAATNGSPLYLLEMLKLALERGALTISADMWESPNPTQLRSLLRAGEGLRARLESLTREQRWVLLILGLAGMPLDDGTLRQVSQRDVRDVDQNLGTLEHLGLVARHGGITSLTHDSIAEMITEISTLDAVGAAERGLGRALAETTALETTTLRRAARHLVNARDSATLQRVLRRFVLASRRLGDERSPRALTADLLGADHADQVSPLMRSLPTSWRLGLWSRQRLGLAAAAAFLVMSGALWFSKADSAPLPTSEARFYRIGRDSAVDELVLPFGADAGDPGAPMKVAGTWRRMPGTERLHLVGQPVWNHAGTRAVLEVGTGNVTTTDLYEYNGTRVRRLTDQARDDATPQWQADDSSVFFLTARWSPKESEDYDIATLGVRSGTVRQLVVTREFELGASPSPDGTRIAFLRRFHHARPTELCWASWDGRIERCRIPAGTIASIHGWLDANTLFVQVIGEEGDYLATISMQAGPPIRISEAIARRAALSPNRQWVICECASSPDDPPDLVVFPLADPRQVRRLDFGADDAPPFFSWRPTRTSAHYLDTLRVATGTRGVPVDAASRMAIEARDDRGERIGVVADLVRWRVADTSLATIDSITGMLQPKKKGRVTVVASAGGWRTAVKEITITAPTVETDFREPWDSLAPTRWRFFGDPVPKVIDGSGFLNNGDGSYLSGAFTRVSFDASGGLGVEAELRTPVNQSRGQTLIVALTSKDYYAFGSWDYETGEPPRGPSREGCIFAFPSGEGGTARSRMGLVAGPVSRSFPMDSAFAAGTVYQVRIQVFPDGTCDFWVDGRPIWRSKARILPAGEFILTLEGSSVGTQMLVGPLSIWRGVKTGRERPE